MIIREDFEDTAERGKSWIKDAAKLPFRIWEALNFETKAVASAVIAGAILLLILLAIIVSNVGSCRTRNLGKKANTAANKQINLEKKREEIKSNANVEIRVIEKEKEQSNSNINQALENVNKVRSKDYSNTNLSDAQKARCNAYPESCK
jgi:hypothetical protein